MAEQAAPLGPQDLAAIRACADGATPGPWQQSLSARDAVIAPAGPLEIGSDAWRYYGGRLIGESISPSDRMFIITARTDVPRLLDAYADLARAARAYLDACGFQFLGDCSQTGLWGEIVTAEQALRRVLGQAEPPATDQASKPRRVGSQQ